MPEVEAPLAGPSTAGGSAVGALLSAGTIDGRQHAAGSALAACHRRFDAVARTAMPGRMAALPEPAGTALEAEGVAPVAAAGWSGSGRCSGGWRDDRVPDSLLYRRCDRYSST